MSRQPSVQQTSVITTWPFDMWKIDLIEKFSKSRNGHKYLIVVVDYFSKWIQVKPLANPTEENALNFFHYFILCRYGVPRDIITNYGTQFSTKFSVKCTRLDGLPLPISRGMD